MLALHGLVPPTKMTKNPNNKSEIWKYSINDSRNYTFIDGQTVNEFETNLQDRIDTNRKFKISTNVMIGYITYDNEPTTYLVVFDEIRYKFTTILEAIEYAIAIHFIFGIQYQVQSIAFWKIIQGLFFNIPLEKPTSAEIITHIRNLKQLFQ